MNITILPSQLHGTISAPPSKSISHRAIILASLAHGTSTIKNILLSDDTKRTIDAMKAFGVDIQQKGSTLTIQGSGGKLSAPKEPINLGLSGSSMRLITAVAALANGLPAGRHGLPAGRQGTTILTGKPRLLERPNNDLVTALRMLGITLTQNPSSPLTVQGGTLKGGFIEIPGNISSQFISAILLIAPFAKDKLTIAAKDLRSKPYVDITIDVMKTFGVHVEQKTPETFTIVPQEYKATDYTVEGDYSSASYFFAANAITNSHVDITGLNPNSKQADSAIIDILSRLKHSTSNLTIDMGNSPDIVQTVTIVAAFRQEITTISNISHIRHKETDRISKTAEELGKMGIKTEITEDSLTIYGGKPHTTTIQTHNDHRMAMSFAIAGLAIPGGITIENAEVVSKSYPRFWKNLESLGVKLSKREG